MSECIWVYLRELVLEQEILGLSPCSSTQKDEFTCLELYEYSVER